MDQADPGGPLGAGFDYYFGDDVPNMPPYAFIENDRLTCDPIDMDGADLRKQQVMQGGYIHGTGPGQKDWQLNQVMPTITAKAVEIIKKKSKSEIPSFSISRPLLPTRPLFHLRDFRIKLRQDPMEISLPRQIIQSGKLWQH